MRGFPVARLLLDLTPEAVVALLDFKYVEHVPTPEQTVAVLVEQASARPEREAVLSTGCPDYDTFCRVVSVRRCAGTRGGSQGAFVQADCTRLAGVSQFLGVSEFLIVSLLARKYKLPVVPHVGDMGQIHQHLVLFNHIALGLEIVFLEHAPHLRDYFLHPAQSSRRRLRASTGARTLLRLKGPLAA